LASMDFPPEPWRGIPSTNVLERLNRELVRRCDGVGIFPNVAAVLRLLGALREEQQDEGRVQRRYFSQASMAKLYDTCGSVGEQTREPMGALAMVTM